MTRVSPPLRQQTRGWTAALVAALALAAQSPATTAAIVRVAWIPDPAQDSIHVAVGLLAFHDGGLDFFDHDRPAPDLLARSVPAMQVLGEYSLQEALRADHPLAEFRVFLSAPHPAIGGILDPTPPRFPRANFALLDLVPGRHDYLSFLLPLQPSNDAFAGNEEPKRHRLFDQDGRFLGPFQIEVFGTEVLDAGLCDNDEAGLVYLDRPVTGGPQACADGEGVVRHHPGLNGSVRNPDGMPVRVLGATSTYSPNRVFHYDANAADFSRPGRRLGRLLVSAQTGWVGPSGSWYSPERAGEGFSLQILPPVPGSGQPRALVYWYTYAPDGSGRQLWLTGAGTLGGNTRPLLGVFLHATRGGRFASTSNPGTVENLPWGSLQIEFDRCDRATATWTGNDPAFGSGSFVIRRLGPPVQGLDWQCSSADPFHPRPGPTP